MNHDFCVAIAAFSGAAVGFLVGYHRCRHIIRCICETEAGIEITRRVFGEIPPK